MGWVTGAAVYFIIWWLVLFMVLPWGVRPIDGADIAKGHAPSAPQRPRMLLKVAVTSFVAAIFWAVVYAVIDLGLISFRG
jgi:predicted secreted protein